MARNSVSITDVLKLPHNQVVEIGREVAIRRDRTTHKLELPRFRAIELDYLNVIKNGACITFAGTDSSFDLTPP